MIAVDEILTTRDLLDEFPGLTSVYLYRWTDAGYLTTITRRNGGGRPRHDDDGPGSTSTWPLRSRRMVALLHREIGRAGGDIHTAPARHAMFLAVADALEENPDVWGICSADGAPWAPVNGGLDVAVHTHGATSSVVVCIPE